MVEADGVLSRLRAGTGLDGLGLQRFDGRWDLRGIAIESPVITSTSTVHLVGSDGDHEIHRVRGVTKLQGCELSDLDLTGATLPSLSLTECVVRNCRFDEAVLSGIRVFGSRFEDCSFDGANLRNGSLGGKSHGRRPSYTRVTFRGATLNGLIPGDGDFEDCDFSRAKMRGAEFWDARLRRCRFAGRLDRVIFAARRPVLGVVGRKETLIDVDFSESEFRMVEFRGLDLASVTLPTSPGHIVVSRPRCVMEQALRAARAEQSPDKEGLWFIGLIEAELEWLGRNQEQAVLAIHDLGTTPTSRERAATMIRAAAAACR